jgi:hypothetical protein
MTDIIFSTYGEEKFRIPSPFSDNYYVVTKCPTHKLEIKERKMTEIEKTEGEIKVLQAKLELLKEIEKHKSPVEEAYKRVYGFYPETYEDSWSSFQDGYIASQKDYKVGEFQPTPQEPEELKTLYEMWWNDGECRDDICYLVKIWMSQYADNVMCGEYKKGYEYCLLVLEENLK